MSNNKKFWSQFQLQPIWPCSTAPNPRPVMPPPCFFPIITQGNFNSKSMNISQPQLPLSHGKTAAHAQRQHATQPPMLGDKNDYDILSLLSRIFELDESSHHITIYRPSHVSGWAIWGFHGSHSFLSLFVQRKYSWTYQLYNKSMVSGERIWQHTKTAMVDCAGYWHLFFTFTCTSLYN